MSSIFNSAKAWLRASIVVALFLTSAATASASVQSYLAQRLSPAYFRYVQRVLASRGINLHAGGTTTGSSSTTTSSGSGGLTHTGSGTLTLGGGTGTLGSGTITLNSGNSNSGGLVISGGTLSNGSLGLSGSNGGTLQAGAGTTTNINLSAGTLTYTGSTTVNSGGLVISGGTLQVSGSTTFSGVSNLGATLTKAGGGTLILAGSGSVTSSGGILTLGTINDTSGTTFDLNSATIIGSASGGLSIHNWDGQPGTHILFSASGDSAGTLSMDTPSAATPEPGSVILAGCGFAALFLARRRFASKR